MNSSMLKVTSKEKLPCLVIRDTIRGEIFPQGSVTKDIIMYENPQEELDIIDPPEITYNGTTKPNTKVEMLSETGEVLATTTSNSEGKYSFKPSKPLIPNVTKIKYRYTYSDGTPMKTTELEIGYKKDYSNLPIVAGMKDVDLTYTLKQKYAAGDKITITLGNDPTIKKEYILTAEDITNGKAIVKFPVYKGVNNFIQTKLEHLADHTVENLNTAVNLMTNRIKPKIYVQFRQGNQRLSEIWGGRRQFTLALKYKGEVLYFTYNVSHEARNIVSYITNRTPITYIQKLADPSVVLKAGGIGFLPSDKCNDITIMNSTPTDISLVIGQTTNSSGVYTPEFIRLDMEKTLGNVLFRVKDTTVINLPNGQTKPFVGFTIDLPGFYGTSKDAENILKELEIEWGTGVRRTLYQEWYPLYINEACDNMLMHRANPLYSQYVSVEQFENLCSSRKVAEFRSYTYKKPYYPPYTSNDMQTNTMQLYPVFYDPMSEHPTTSFVIGWDKNAMLDALVLSDTYLEDKNIATITDKNGVLFLPYKFNSPSGVLSVKKCPVITNGDTTMTNLMFVGSALAKDKEYSQSDGMKPFGMLASMASDRQHSYIMYKSTLDKYLAGGVEAFDTYKDFYVETDMTMHQQVRGVIPADKYNSLKVYFKDYLSVFASNFKNRVGDTEVHTFSFRFTTTRSRIYEIYNGTAQMYYNDFRHDWRNSIDPYPTPMNWISRVSFNQGNSISTYPYTLEDVSNKYSALVNPMDKHNSLLFLTSISRYLTPASEYYWRRLKYPPSNTVFTLAFKVEKKSKDGINPPLSSMEYPFTTVDHTFDLKDALYYKIKFNHSKEGRVPSENNRNKLWDRVDVYLAKDSAVGGVKITMPRVKDDYGFKQGGQGIYLEIPCKIVLSVADAPVGIYNESKKIPYNSSQELVLEDDWMRQYKNYRYIYPKEAYASVTTLPEKYLDWVVTTDTPSIFINTPTNPGRIPYVQVGLMFEFPYDNLSSPVSYYDPSGLTTNYANYNELYRKAKEYIFNNIYIALSQFKFQIK
nr:MAG TPA: hypothetical protein [Caudoviricetes sp.]